MKVIKVIEVDARHGVVSLTLILTMFLFGAYCGYQPQTNMQQEISSVEDTKEELILWVEYGDTIIPYEDYKKLPEPSGFTLESDADALKENIYAWYDAYYLFHGKDYVKATLEYEGIIKQVADNFNIDPDIICGVIALESKGNPYEVSKVNAKGLMQIYWVPKSYRQKAKKILGVNELDDFNPIHNVTLGTITLIGYTKMKNNNLLLGMASYVWGPNNISDSSKDFSSVRHRFPEVPRYYPNKALALTLLTKVYKEKGEFIPYKLNCSENDLQCKEHEKQNQQYIESIQIAGLHY